MKRALTRIYRRHGVKYFATPVIIFLCLALLADHFIPDYIQKIRRDSQVREAIQRHTTVVSKGKEIQEKFDSVSAIYQSTESFLLVRNDQITAAADFQALIQDLLGSLYFSDIQIISPPSFPNQGTGPISFTVRFFGVPQQLPRLEKALASSPIFITTDALDIRVVDDAERGGKQLLATVQFSALYVQGNSTSRSK